MHALQLGAIVMVVAVACRGGLTSESPTQPAATSGYVVGPSGESMADVIVTFSDPETGKLIERAITDSAGHFVSSVKPGAYAVAAASSKGWHWTSRLRVTHEPVALHFSTDCKRQAGRVAVPSRTAKLDDAFVTFSRVSMDSGDRFTVPLESDGSFSVCLPDASYVVKADGSLMSTPELLSDTQRGTLEVAAFPRESVLQAAPKVPAAAEGLNIAAFVSSIPDHVAIVGIGESNHGSREFLEWRRDISLRLATTKGFRVILLEAGFGETLEIDRYVQGEAVDVRKAVEKLGYWMWDTEDFIGVLEALRNHNARSMQSERIRVWGMDVQDTAGSIAALASSPQLDSEEKALFVRLGRDRGAEWKAWSTEERKKVEEALKRIERTVPYTTDALASIALRYRLEAILLPLAQLVTRRDEGMAEIVLAVSRIAPEGKVVLWAHNFHVAREPADGYPMLGQHLSRHMGDAYYPIGLFQAGGRARAWDESYAIGVIPHELPRLTDHQLEQALLNTTNHMGGFVLPSRLTPAMRDWLSTPRFARQFGAHLRSDMPLHTHMKAFAAFGIVPAGSPTTPTPTGVRKAPT